MSRLHNAVQGSLMGCAVGDALGAPYEGLWGHTIPIERDLINGYGHYEGFEPGQYTDDTQHTLSTVQNIVQTGGLYPSQVAEALFRMWQSEQIIGPGGSCMRAMEAYGESRDWRECGAPIGEAGNGTAMRTTALGIYFINTPQRLNADVASISRITHQDPRSVAGGVAVAKAALLLYNSPNDTPQLFCDAIASSVQPLCSEFASHINKLPTLISSSHDEAMESIAWAGQPKLFKAPIITPFIIPTVLACLYAVLKHPDDWCGAVACVISMGGDVDTTGAIVGSMMGTKLGVDAIPLHLRQHIVERDAIESLGLRYHALINRPSSRPNSQIDKIHQGAILNGIIAKLTEYGAVVDLGEVEGLLLLHEMRWTRITAPSQMFEVGQRIKVLVLHLSPDGTGITLSYKQLTPDPWENIESRYPSNSRVTVRVVSLIDYGAFVELEEGIEGLIHISEMSWTKRIKHPNTILTVGDEVACLVLNTSPNSRLISLSMKQLEPDPEAP